MVRKKDHKLEPFDVKKIGGLQKACEKRPITMDQINELAGLVRQAIMAKGKEEVTSKEIGDLVMKYLKDLDRIAYIRFASVYKRIGGKQLTIKTLEGGEEAKRECPNCHSKRKWKDGTRETNHGTVQRFRCQDCGYRFSEKSNIELDTNRCRQLSAILKEAKKLDAQTQTRKICAGDGNLLNYAWLLKKRGLADNTINLRVSTLRLIQKKGVNLHNPDSFETMIATEDLTSARKWMFVSCYKSYTKMMKIPWNPIRVKYEPKQPFLPTNDEINTFIHASSKRLATLLQTLLTTGARIGEICKLKWIDIDIEKNTISINDAEKGSRNRTIKVPAKTIAMINALPRRKSGYIFNTKPCNVRVNFQNLRRKLARSQNNPRLLQVHLHTFRHFYATETLRRTKNLSYVKYTLGHKSIMNTERYTHLIEFENVKYHSAVAKTEQERRELIEDGWSFVEKSDGISYYRKPR